VFPATTDDRIVFTERGVKPRKYNVPRSAGDMRLRAGTRHAKPLAMMTGRPRGRRACGDVPQRRCDATKCLLGASDRPVWLPAQDGIRVRRHAAAHNEKI